MKKLIMFVMVLAIATPAGALIWPTDAPGFAGCENSGQVLWEFEDAYCLPTSNVADPPYYYDPELGAPTFGGRHWDDPTDDAGWGGSYGADLWTWSDGVFTVLAEDSFNQPMPERGEHIYLRQYFEVVHTLVPGLEEDDYRWPIGLGLELWDMSVYQTELGGWTGCPVGYETLPGDGYREGYESVVPFLHYELSGGWYKSVWMFDFSEDGSVTTIEDPQAFGDLFEATHIACILGMDFAPPAESFQIEEIYLNFIWFSDPGGSDIPDEPCYIIIVPQDPPVEVKTEDIPIYEPKDEGGPDPMGPTSGKLKVRLAWKPGDGLGYPPFTAEVVVDPDPNQENAGSADFSFTNPVPPDPNGNVTLTFTQADYNVFQDITVAATADLLREGPEGFKAELTVTIDIADCNFGGPGCEEPVVRTAGIQVIDNDIPYISVLPAGQLMNILTENSPGVPRCVNITLSHMPTDNVEVRAALESDYGILVDSMVVMDPNFEDWTDPNHLLFTPGTYNTPQQICLTALDDDERGEGPDDEGLEWIPGFMLLNGLSDDPRYRSEEEEDGELAELAVSFNVQDNECGAWGYDYADLNGDCVVDLSEIVGIYGQWLFCTDPYDDDTEYAAWDKCDALWNLVEEE